MKGREPSVFVGVFFVAVGSVLATAADARGVSPYLPLNLSPEIERQIERVLILGDKPILKRPIAAATVLDALPRACEIDPVLCRNVRAYLETFMRPLGVVSGGVEIATTDNASAPLPNRHGVRSDTEYAVDAQFQWQAGDLMVLALGGYAYQGEATATGTVLSLGWDFAQLDVGYRDRWLSPLYDSSMLTSTNAPTIPSITLSNYAPISRLGFGYELFVGELSESDEIAFGDRFTSGRPRIAGLHVSIEPAPGYSLGASRLIQCGGGERSGCSGKDIFDALLNPYESDNRQEGLTQDEEVGNQQAAFTSQFIFPGAIPFTAYFEYAGEDTSYDSNYRLGNAALSAGIRFPQLWRVVDVFYEASDWQNGWYVHGIYYDGPTNEGRVIGHWGGDYRAFRDGIGAQAHTVGLGWAPPFGGSFQATYRTLANERYSGIDYERAHIGSLRYSRAVGAFTVGAEVVTGRDVFGDSFTRVAAFGRMGSQWASGGRTSIESRRTRERGAELFVDAGYNVTELRVLTGVVSPSLKTDVGYEGGMSFGLGARRAVSQQSDLGVRVDLADVHGEYFIGVRALDYRYRFDQRFAVTAFLGAARYEVDLPAYGFYLGIGGQVRNVLPNVDVGVDFRYADKVARDKLLPTDLPSTARPDIFYDMQGAVVSMSYRW